MNSGETLYVYDGSTGQVQYTVDNAAPEQIQHFKETNVPFYVGPSNGKIIGTYIKKDEDTGIPCGISQIRHMNFLTVDKKSIVANGTDEATISGLRKVMHVNINNEYAYVVDDKTGTTLEISANNFSYIPHHNEMTIKVRGYGYHDAQVKLDMIEEGT